mgnify:CR=1 FL=1
MNNQKTDDSLIIEIIERGQLGDILLSPLGLVTLISCIFLVGIYIKKGFSRRKKLARARWAGKKEKLAAQRQACKQLENAVYNEAAAYISTIAVDLPIRVKDKFLLRLPPSSKRLYLPDVNRGIFVGGSNGSGKSFSAINPLIRSQIDQAQEIYLYDNKLDLGDKSQTARIAGYALERGYEVHLFAPGYPESGIINPLDFLKDELDTSLAAQLAITINANFKSKSNKGDDFFQRAANLLTEGLFLYTKDTKHCDMLMCFALLCLDNLPQRLYEARDVRNQKLPTAFSQLIGCRRSEKTAESITASAFALFNSFVKWDLLPAFCGTTTVPLESKRRKMIIFGSSEENREVTAPLIAAIIHLLVSKNMSSRRNHSLVCALDEFPTLYLPSLSRWLNEKREQGFIGILGLQEYSQLEEKYGKEAANIIFTGCVTKLLFSTGSEITADKFSKYLGEEEIINTRTNQTIGKSGNSRSIQQESAKRPLFEVSQFNTLPRGQAVVISPGFASNNQANLPLLHKFEMTDEIKELEARSVRRWNQYKQQLIARNLHKQMSYEDLESRIAEAKGILPTIAEINKIFMDNQPHLQRNNNQGDEQ